MRIVAGLLAALLGACASAPEPEVAGAPVVALTPGLPAPPQARLYADCVAQAAETGAYQRERDGGTLRFTCAGETAKSFYDGVERFGWIRVCRRWADVAVLEEADQGPVRD